TVTLSGKVKLAEEFLSDSQEDIEAKQEAAKELSHNVDWRQGFAVAGMDVEENPALKRALENWLKTKSSKSIFTSPYLLYPLAGITFGLLVFWLVETSLQSFTWLSYAFMANLTIVFSQFKKIKKEYEQLNKISQTLTLYSRLLRHVESQNFESTLLVNL